MPVRYSSRHDDSRRAQPVRGLKIKRHWDPSASRSGLIASSIAFWFVTSALLAVGAGVLFLRKRRPERAVSDLSEQVLQLTRDAGAVGRVELKGNGALGQLGAAVNELLEKLQQRGARLQDREQLFQRLV